MTTTITVIDRANFRWIAEQLDAKLAELGAELGVKFETRGGTFSNEGWGDLKVRVSVIGESGVVETKEACALKQWAKFNGGADLVVGFRFTQPSGREYELVGYKPRSPKFPFVAKDVQDGKTYKFQRSTVERNLEAAVAQGADR